MHRYWLCLVFFVFALGYPAHALDGLGDSGGLQPYPGQKSRVRLVSEKIRIEFFPLGNYSVTTDYVFENLGQQSNVLLCLPVDDTMLNDGGNTSRKWAKPGLTADGHSLILWKQNLLSAQAKTFGASYNLLWKTKITFKKGQTRHVRLRYVSQTYGGCGDIMTYALASGKWKGTVAETSLSVINVAPAAGDSVIYWADDPKLGEHHINMQSRGENIYKRWTKYKLNGTFIID